MIFAICAVVGTTGAGLFAISLLANQSGLLAVGYVMVLTAGIVTPFVLDQR